MSNLGEWLEKMGAIGLSEEDEEEKVEIKPRYMTSVLYIQVLPPPGRKDLDCEIYGEISFNDGPNNRPVTLFRRSKEDPDFLTLGDDSFSRLCLADIDQSDRPLIRVTESDPIYVNMELHEVMKRKGKRDKLVAEVRDFKYGTDMVERCMHFKVPGRRGFVVQVAYAVVFGACAEVELKINGGGNPIPRFWGHVSAYQCLLEEHIYGKTSEALFYRYDHQPEAVSVDSCIGLDRRLIVVPMLPFQYLTIGIALVEEIYKITNDEDRFTENLVHFPVKMVDPFSFLTNKSMTHTKQVPDTLYSVSIKFLSP